MEKLLLEDKIIFVVYFFIVAGYGYYIYRKKKKAVMDTHDFFLAEGSLTWWAIGASLIASNISAEQFIGMSGNGFSFGCCRSCIRVDSRYCTHHCGSMVYTGLSEK